jgi:[acyl-carrier-protein] S-malonyltransferase
MRAIPLSVSAPSHCALMRPAAERLQKVLENVKLGEPEIPVIHNVDVASRGTANEIRDALTRQLWQPVRWSDTIMSLLGQGVERFAECGPGKVLAGLNRRITRPSTIVALVDYASLVDTAENWS